MKTFFFVVLSLFIACIALSVVYLSQTNSKWAITFGTAKKKISVSDSVSYLQVPTVVSTLSGRSTHICKAGFTLAVGKTVSDQVSGKKYMNLFKDNISSLVSMYSFENLSTIEGKRRLKRHVKSLLNENLKSDIVQDVYFRELVIQ